MSYPQCGPPELLPVARHGASFLELCDDSRSTTVIQSLLNRYIADIQKTEDNPFLSCYRQVGGMVSVSLILPSNDTHGQPHAHSLGI